MDIGRFLKNLNFYIDQYDQEKQVFKLGNEIKKRGWLTREEFFRICLWKSRRPKNLYELNTKEEIEEKTKRAFSEIHEVKRMVHLTELKGVRIPTASAILSVYNPEDYPIIDERCIQALKELNLITWSTITSNSWLMYLEIIRSLSKENGKTAREIEKGLFALNRLQLDNNHVNLYNS